MAEEKKIPLVLEVNGAKAIKTVGELKKGIADTRAELEKTEVGTKRFDELSESVRQAEGRMKELNSQSTFLSDMPGPIGAIATSFNATRTAILRGVTALKTLRVAIAATGIGLLLTAFASLQAYFTRTEEGAQKLRVIMAFLGAAVDKVADVFVKLGEDMFNAFENPRKSIEDFASSIRDTAVSAFEYLGEVAGAVGSIIEGVVTLNPSKISEGVGELSEKFDGVKESVNNATKSIGDFSKEVLETANAGAELEKALNTVLVKERELRVERAEANKTLSEQRNLAKDLNLSLEERINALTMANEMEQELLARELENENERLRILEEKAALAKSDEDTLNAIADQQVRVANIEEQSLNKRRELQEQLSTLKRQDAAEQKALNDERLAEIAAQDERERELRAQLRQANIELIEDEEEKELELNAEKFEEKLERITGESELEQELRNALLEQQLRSEQDIRDKYAKTRLDADAKAKAEEKKAEEDLAKAKISVAQSLGSALGSIQSAITGQSKEAVTARKVLAIAQIAIDTAIAVSGAIAQAQSVPFPANIAAIATGVAAVISGIASAVTTLNSANVGGGSAPAPQAPTVTSAPTFTPVSTNTTELNNTEQAELAPIQAFVVETELTGNQNNVNQIESQATFG